MTNDKLEEALGRLGIDRDRVGLVALLPLVQVAWADGRVQEEERRIVLGLAERHGLLGEEDRAIVETWLAEAPSAWFLDTSTKVVHALAARARLPEGLGQREVVAWCWALATAAGGLFGTSFLAIDTAEREALDRIASALGIGEVPEDWRSLKL